MNLLSEAAVGPDRFGGITVKLDDRFISLTLDTFAVQLIAAMGDWKTAGTRGVWYVVTCVSGGAGATASLLCNLIS
jgi:hypothetical protein